ncbi:MAG: ABC transporter ATP-binding protein [Rhodobacteraceae bacterium]|nr:ABC transporter ATP-binding protein [Paracoccaceae bacterium]
MAEPALETRSLTVRFGGHVAVDAVSCRFRAGELTAIVGPNGAGKTTYFNAISGRVHATQGQILLDGQDITRLPMAARTRRGLGRAFQLTSLFPGLSVFENVRLAVQARQRKGARLFALADADHAMADAARAVLDQVQLRHLSGRLAGELSHGDQRKLEVGLLIALEPRVFLFDEPTAGMSADAAPAILRLIEDIRRDATRCVLLVEHRMGVVRRLADRIIVLHNGALAADGTPAEVMAADVVRDAYLGRSLADA